MALDALFDLRNSIRRDVPLEEFFIAHYGKPAKHIVGYKRSPNANDYPCLCYVPVKTKKQSLDRSELISVIIGIKNEEIVDDVMIGHLRVAQAAELLEPIIESGRVGPKTLIFDDYEIFPDMGERHPFYETELVLKLARRQ